MDTLFYILMFMVVPVGAGLFARYYLRSTYTWKEFGINLGATLALVSVVFFAGKYHNLSDTEIWNGKILSKHRDEGFYIRTYQCNCSNVCSGTGDSRSCTQVCQTCTENRYTVTWYAKSSVGKITFDHLDSASRSVYSRPDPDAYKICTKGEPAALEKSYINYVKAAPDSLFNTSAENTTYTIPAYPRVYSFYRINRVINIGAHADEMSELNDLLNNQLIAIGEAKQVNIVVIATELDDPNYRHAVENAWIGAKKNDVVVFLGLDGNNFTWVDVMTWALNGGNELFAATLKQELTAIGSFDAVKISTTISSNIKSLYDRPKMEDYEYLKDSIDPPSWLILACLFASIVLTGSLTYYFHKNEIA